MGQTFFKRLENRSRSAIRLVNKADSGTRGHNIIVPAGSSIAVDMAIPWAPAQTDFPTQHLEIVVGGVTRYWIWQAARTDGDFIRFSTDGAWHDPGEHAHGYAGVAANFFDAVAGLFSTDRELTTQINFTERALVVLDSHFETVPIAPKQPFPVTVIKQLENRSTSSVTILSTEPFTQSVTAAPGQTVPLNLNVPWAGSFNDFPNHHLRVSLAGVTRFWIWQADNRNDGDYVRFSTNGSWTPFATRVKGFAGTGRCDADLVFTPDRSITVFNTDFEIMPHPLLLDFLLDFVKPLVRPAQRVSETMLDPPPPSVPKKFAVAFSQAGPVSDAFKRRQPDARLLYKESGKRYEFEIDSTGTVLATHPDGTITRLDKAWSFTERRKGNFVIPPPFDLIAADGARVFAKAKDRNDFYFASLDHIFVHKAKDAPPEAPELSIPSQYFKLDPEFGKSNIDDLLSPIKNVPSTHPTSERHPIFRRVFEKQVIDMMIATVKPDEHWQQLDFRPPQNVAAMALRDVLPKVAPLALQALGLVPGLGPIMVVGQIAYFLFFQKALTEALTTGAILASAPPAGTPTYTPIKYRRDDGLEFEPPAISYQKVLDIGVGHVHHHQQYHRITGGEIQAMLLVPFYAALYRFFNGAVQDGDGYIDGTSNFYALVKHQPGPNVPPSYSLLYQDEQLYFSQRWRLVNPDDHQGTLFSLTGDLSKPEIDIPGIGRPREYKWNPETYWCPFKSGHINDNSRLAVAAQVLLVTGINPPNEWRIYSINFSWGSMDHTWRWRKLPVDWDVFDGAAIAAGNETIEAGDRERVYPQTIRLRADMTLHMKGVRRVLGKLTVGHWYQRYLPADNNLVPDKIRLVAGQMPANGYAHHWKFLPEDKFRLVDNFHFFGVYDVVDSRTQYYEVTPATTTDAAKLQASPGPWIDDARQLYCSQWKFRWHDPRLPGADPLDSPSLFNPDTWLRIVKKGSRWIAMFWDKRDDDMMPFERRPMRVTLKRTNDTGVIETVQVTIGAHRRVMEPPVVQQAYSWLEPNGGAGVAFESRGATLDALRENISRVRMASLEADANNPKRVGRVNTFLDMATEGIFSPIGRGLFEFRWTPTAAEQALLREHASSDGEMRFATSIWFEDIIGNVAPPERISWQRSATAQGVATPAMVPLGVPTQVTVHATDLRTGTTLMNAVVRVDEEEVGTSGVPFTFIFRTHFEEEPDSGPRRPLITAVIEPVITVEAPGYPAVQVPVTFFTPRLELRMEPAAVPIGPTSQVIVRALDATTKALVQGRAIIAGVDVGPTNQPFNFAFGPTSTSGVVNASGYPSRSFAIGLFTPEMQISVSPSPVWTGRPVEVIVRAVDKVTGAPVNGRVKLNGVDTAATNTPFMFTFGLTAPVGVVSAPFYADASIPWQLSISTMVTGITPFPAPLNRTVQATVSAINQQTGAPVAGRVRVNGVDVGPTNTPITTIFRMKLSPDLDPIPPRVDVSAPGYRSTPVNLGFEEAF